VPEAVKSAADVSEGDACEEAKAEQAGEPSTAALEKESVLE
jgi:hypothetical protein